MAMIELRKEWKHLMRLSGIPPAEGQVEFMSICRAYSEPHRHYHTLKHLEHVLLLLKDIGFDSPAGLWAVWYHDYIYEPGENTNEARSAEHAKNAMNQLGIECSVTNRAVDIILATKDHKAEAISDEMLIILDADMAILGETQAKYEEYCRQVENEFRSVPKTLYGIGRRSFLESVLKQSQIYKTSWFFEKYEARARQNIVDEINSLKVL